MNNILIRTLNEYMKPENLLPSIGFYDEISRKGFYQGRIVSIAN